MATVFIGISDPNINEEMNLPATEALEVLDGERPTKRRRLTEAASPIKGSALLPFPSIEFCFHHKMTSSSSSKRQKPLTSRLRKRTLGLARSKPIPSSLYLLGQ